MRGLVLLVLSAGLCAAAPVVSVGRLVGLEGDRLLLSVARGGTQQVVQLTLADNATIALATGPGKADDLWQGDWLQVTADDRTRRVSSLEPGVSPLAVERCAGLKARAADLALDLQVGERTAHCDAAGTAALLDHLTGEGFLANGLNGGQPLTGPGVVTWSLRAGNGPALVESRVWTTVQRARLSKLAELSGQPALKALVAQVADLPAPAEPRHEVLGGYFVNNTFEPDAPTSFAVLKDSLSLDRVVGVGFVMGDRSHRMAPSAFGSRLVLAAIHRGAALWEYTVRAVTLRDGVLTLDYAAASKAQAGATFACPLLVCVPKGDYQSVEFREGGQVVKRLAAN